ncbi:6-bladed beta-propeller [Rhodothermus marinus]|uniref:6-bladed beta-propeller n=1 Tax=Rhodothermus marinus (strain ATCC 43812 / DSM 4252 / R-10) TaxID=518766 RepID=D0MIZ0_RHOM4|nr:6-bladed beta-propeller [Rhodothermus marinus]ACY48448.1 hypothetical protein Rmar_1561 [Rhodothermus marinus DSM 4252]
MSKKVFVTTLLVVLTGLVLWWVRPARHEAARSLIAVAQDTIGWIGHGGDVVLYDALLFKGYDHALYVADQGDLSIKKFDPNGKLLRRYGGIRGEGPGELQSIVDFSIHENNLWIADVRQRRILHFDVATGRYLGEVQVPEIHPLRIVQVGPYLIVLGLGPFEELFVQYDTSGRFHRRFGIVTDRQYAKKIGMSGQLASLGDTAFVFVPLMAGYAFIFDTTGTLRGRFPLLDERPFPDSRVEDRPEGRLYIAPTSDTLNRNILVEENQLYVHTAYRKPVRRLFIDAYLLPEGRYVHSIEVANAPLGALLGGDRVYVLDDTLVAVLRLRQR